MKKVDFMPTNHQSPNSRPLRVGEEIRHALAFIFMRGETNDPVIDKASVTVSEVRVSPDLKNATAFVMPLGGRNKEAVLEALVRAAPEFRRQIASKVELRYMPRIHFKLDESYDVASKIDALLKSPGVARDLAENDKAKE